jgi:hypothetical protein
METILAVVLTGLIATDNCGFGFSIQSVIGFGSSLFLDLYCSLSFLDSHYLEMYYLLKIVVYHRQTRRNQRGAFYRVYYLLKDWM